jgi:Predicted esterase of the alpha-beta hydrolase superfamily
MEPKTLVLSGGGIKGFGMLGMLHKLALEQNVLNHTINFVGSSAGGVIVALLCFDLSPIEIFIFFLDLLPMNYSQDRDRVLSSLKNIIGDTTFSELYDQKGKVLVLTSFDKKNRDSLYYSKDTSPTKKIIEAVHETSNMPFLMTSADVFIDGCLCSPFPIKYAKDKFCGSLLGIYTTSTNANLLPIPNPYDDLKIVLQQLFNTLTLYEIFFASKDDLILHFDNRIPFELFQVDFQLAKDLFISGYEQTHTKI